MSKSSYKEMFKRNPHIEANYTETYTIQIGKGKTICFTHRGDGSMSMECWNKTAENAVFVCTLEKPHQQAIRLGMSPSSVRSEEIPDLFNETP
jgi:hypothetical protein